MARVRTSHIILDRDGVLNEEPPCGGHVRSANAWRWLPGALEALAILSRAALRVSVATNQAGVGRGIMTSAELEAVHANMMSDAFRTGGHVSAVFACAHAPDDGCHCRKPAPGLIQAAIDASGMDAAAALVVGDDLRDIEASRAAGVGSVLILTGQGQTAAAMLPRGQIPVYDDLLAFTRWFVAVSADGDTGRS